MLDLKPFDIFRVVASITADEIGAIRQTTVSAPESLAWDLDTVLGEGVPGSLGLDSLGRIDVATRVNQFFHLHETGIEDYLLTRTTLGEWSAIVVEAMRLGASGISFRTSGSTGEPRTVAHTRSTLDAEARELASVLPPHRRVVSLVPPHHIYGFIFTVLLPAAADRPVIDARAMPPGRLRAELAEDDLLIATPHLWRYLLGSLGAFPRGVNGVSSTAPMPADLAASLAGAGLASLTEVYGSSETSGIGWRRAPTDPFALFSCWEVAPDVSGLRREGGPWLQFPDHVAMEGARSLRPTGRRDGAVQVGGVNVFPERVRSVLREYPSVADAAVRAFAVGGDAARQRLKTFVVPKDPSADLAGLEAELRAFAAERLGAVERPTAYTFGSALPVNAMGKLQDWG